MKNTTLLLLAVLISNAALSQHSISGKITDLSGKTLPGATVILDNNLSGTSSDENGTFLFNKVKKGSHTVSVSYVGFISEKKKINLTNDTILNFELKGAFYSSDEVVITATRADEKSGMAYNNISKEQIEKQNTGQDIPYLLESVPSLVATSDAGTGIGYTGLRIRGSDPSRVNVTINGIPVNDSESQLLYWVDMPDLASSVENIQVQRGVGTSTNGASAFGGSVNIQTGLTSPEPYLHVSSAYGSFNTFKSNASIGTGLINNKWNFEGRLSKIKSDGYIDRAEADLKSIFLSGGYFGKKDKITLNMFSGKEITYQSWYGVPESALDTNRTWNYYTYDNQVDDYQQDHYQLFYTHEFNSELLFNTAFHYTYGRGYYEEYKDDQELSEYLLDNVIIGNDTITQTDLIRRKWLSNDFYGMTWSFIYSPEEKGTFILGGAYNEYDGDHYGEVIWSQYASNSNIRHRYYFDNGFKTDFNVYAKATIDINDKLSIYADLQYRRINYTFTGPDTLFNFAEQGITHNFFNPKAGVTYTFREGQYAYFSFGVAQKEPSRDDYTESTINSRPESEKLYDFEVGYYRKTDKFVAGFNYFMMQYDNQLVLTGKVNDVGNYTRTNIKKSTREGVELESKWHPLDFLHLKWNMTISKSEINEYREYIDDYDNGGQALSIYKNTSIAFSPDFTGYFDITAVAFKKLELTLTGSYVGKQYLDNTSNDSRSIDPYFINNFRINYTIYPKFMKEILLTAGISNIFNIEYESNGYTFSYLYGGEKVTENYYYPQAGTNGIFQILLKF